jgi:thiosulfate/3-mercaptopyruvate sulfurtransferase
VLKAGHIPGALSFPFNANLQPDGTFRGKEQLSAAVLAVGARPGLAVATYCNTGHVAAIAWFVLHELLGYPNVKLYDGSMLAWTMHGNAAETDVRR